MKFQDLLNKTISELCDMALDIKKEKLNLRIQSKVAGLSSSAQVKKCRRDFARIQTKLRQLKASS